MAEKPKRRRRIPGDSIQVTLLREPGPEGEHRQAWIRALRVILEHPGAESQRPGPG